MTIFKKWCWKYFFVELFSWLGIPYTRNAAVPGTFLCSLSHWCDSSNNCVRDYRRWLQCSKMKVLSECSLVKYLVWNYQERKNYAKTGRMDEDTMFSLILITENLLADSTRGSNKRSKSVSVNIYNVVHYMWSHPQLETPPQTACNFINCFTQYLCLHVLYIPQTQHWIKALFHRNLFLLLQSLSWYFMTIPTQKEVTLTFILSPLVPVSHYIRSNFLLNTYQICLLFHSSVTIVLNSPFFCLNYYNNNSNLN